MSFLCFPQYEYMGDGSSQTSKKGGKKKYKDSDNEDEKGDDGNDAGDAERTNMDTGADTDR